jgi:hypothetical protein
MKYFWFLFVSGSVWRLYCRQIQSSAGVAPGVWRGVLEPEKFSLPPAQKKDDVYPSLYEQFKPGELPFNFERNLFQTTSVFTLKLSMERSGHCAWTVSQYGRDRTLARDTMTVSARMSLPHCPAPCCGVAGRCLPSLLPEAGGEEASDPSTTTLQQ